MIRTLLDLYSTIFARKSLARFNRFMFLLGARGLGILNCRTPYLSGEEPFLKKALEPYDSTDFAVLDVGANQGQFARYVLSATSSLKVISFEPNPAAATKLSLRIPEFMDRHRLIPKGASSHPGQATIFDYGESQGSGHATMYSDVLTSLRQSEAIEPIQIELTTVDLEVESISEKICLLKIDTEGHEREVLLGSQGLLQHAPPPIILVEFNEMNAVSGTHFYELLRLLGDQYQVHRILPGGNLLPLENQNPFYTEIYAYQNLVFLRR